MSSSLQHTPVENLNCKMEIKSIRIIKLCSISLVTTSQLNPYEILLRIIYFPEKVSFFFFCHILIDPVESAQSLQYKIGKFITLSKAKMNVLTLETKFAYILPPLPLLEEQTITESGTLQFSI